MPITQTYLEDDQILDTTLISGTTLKYQTKNGFYSSLGRARYLVQKYNKLLELSPDVRDDVKVLYCHLAYTSTL